MKLLSIFKRQPKMILITKESNNPQSSLRNSSNEAILDEALRFLSNYYFRNDDAGGFVSYTDFWNHMDSRSIYKSECLSLVLFLSRDNKIDIFPFGNNLSYDREPDKIRLNFEGLMFHNSGGYSRAQIDTTNNRRRHDRNERRLVIYTLVLGIATFLLVLTEVLVHRCELDPILHPFGICFCCG